MRAFAREKPVAMKSPEDIAAQLARQWRNADKREALLLDALAWPVRIAIGKPAPSTFERHTAQVREHKERWQAVGVGRVLWESVQFRSAAEPIQLPSHWELSSPEEWVLASGDDEVRLEQQRLYVFLHRTDPCFHALLIRRRSLWRERSDDEVVLATRLALELEPGIAKGTPLRSLGLAGIDSKFIERNAGLVTALLDLRFGGQASEQGLASFLDAADEGEHWLLIAPLAPGLLPFAQQRVRARELLNAPLPAGRILIVENERCLHLLPKLPDTIAILGAGLDLAWLRADWLRQRCLAYWGDMDTWGLAMLARARCLQPQLQVFLMDRELFDRHVAALAVAEPITAGKEPPEGLTSDEQVFYRHLCALPKGRIEQEFLPSQTVALALSQWT